MKENYSDRSSELECSSNVDQGKLITMSRENSEDGKAFEAVETLDPKSDCDSDDPNQSGEDETYKVRNKRRIQLLSSDSDGDSMNETADTNQNQNNIPSDNETNSPSKPGSQYIHHNNILKSISHRSRLRNISASSDNSDSETKKNVSSDELESRIESKRNKLRQKFKSMHNKKTKLAKSDNVSKLENKPVEDNSEDSESSKDEASSIEKIKQKIKERTLQLKSSIYDPDTSDDDTRVAHKEPAIQKKGRKCTKPTSPKPLRMSAKQAMENMQKIKSESNRMLREKEVSLPYHRPKALTLKDIMARKRAAVTADGKALPIKMNDEQLKQYVKILEQRQKEVIELCKSDTEEEEDDEDKTKKCSEDLPEVSSQNDTLYDDMSKTESLVNTDKFSDQVNDESILPDTNMTNELTITKTASNEENPSCDTNVNKKVSNTEVDQTDLKFEEAKSNKDDLEPISVDVNREEPTSDNVNDAKDENNSMEIELIYNDSVEEANESNKKNGDVVAAVNTEPTDKTEKSVREVESQLISLHYDTERSEDNTEKNNDAGSSVQVDVSEEHSEGPSKNTEGLSLISIKETHNNIFSDDDMNIDDIDALIENVELAASQNDTGIVNSPMLIKESLSLSGTPKLTGAPGMVIDLDGSVPLVPKKLTGIELLKERFVYFAKMKTPEELERAREKRIKPGMQHLKLKQELEEQIAEQRSLEWAKRLEDEKQHQKELNALRGEGSDAEGDIDAIEAKLEEKEEAIEKESSSESEEEEELEQEIVDKPRKRNPMVDDEAEESDCDDEVGDGKHGTQNEVDDEENHTDDENEADESEEESSEESEDEQQNKPKKGRILKAFEDSDDEDTPNIISTAVGNENDYINKSVQSDKDAGHLIKNTQDDELHLAQKSISEDLFTSQESSIVNSDKSKLFNNVKDNGFQDKDLGTQTFSILESTTKDNTDIDFSMPDTLSNPRDTQSYSDSLDAVVGMCSGSFSQTQNLVPPSQTAAEVPESQAIGDDVLALCTGQFYDNQFVSQMDSDNKGGSRENVMDEMNKDDDVTSNVNNDNTEDLINKPAQNSSVHTTENRDSSNQDPMELKENKNEENNEKKKTSDDHNLKSILDELNDPEFDSSKPNKYFVVQDKENKQGIANTQFKRKFIIDSDEEGKEEDMNTKKKKIKKKKLEQRALQISDDEEDEQEEMEEYTSELEEEDGERVVEYDSDENEVVVQANNPKKKRKLGEFFENEAELTSEDEWVGSGDEDEAGLDRMEREAGDDDRFNERQLQRELGQIHMREQMDQDKREVRLIQELLLEDADLGGGSRQRKFRWRNADGDEETDATAGELADTQEEEFESEEQWRKQRHEREVFLRSLKNQEEPEESLNSVNRTSIIKASLSKNTSSSLVEVDANGEGESPGLEHKTTIAKDIRSPKKPFTIFQQNYHGSLLTRGRGALARLAALATPLTNDDDTPKLGSLKPTSNRNFVFASTDEPNEDGSKITKRKAESNAGTPRLLKKMRTEDKQKYPKSSLFDHMEV